MTSSSILTINAGSSSIKFALFRIEQPLIRTYTGHIERIGLPNSAMTMMDLSTGRGDWSAIETYSREACVDHLVNWLEQHVEIENLQAIGHRVVHGGTKYSQPQTITQDLLAELHRISPYDPEHMPSEIALIESFKNRYPNISQVACFDTAFHRDMPRVARLLAIPRRYDMMGVQRYGFHGLSYAFLMKELARVGKPGEANGRVILAHLGNGASMAAVNDGKPVDTTMGFTPTSGLPMSRRSGDLDPGLVSYLAQTEGMDAERFHRMVNKESGLLGVSEISSDLRDLLAQEQYDHRAAEAILLFCYQARKAIGALAVSLGGLDTLVFTAGIGEHAPVIRARICQGLEFLGVVIDHRRNGANKSVISQEGSSVTVHVIHTDEEREIAESVLQLLQAGNTAR